LLPVVFVLPNMKYSIASIATLVATAQCVAFPQAAYSPPSYPTKSPSWKLSSLKTLVVFGDSYSDDSRLGYFISHNGAAPPVGYANPVVSL
jgi:hypothetical protein